MMKSRKEIGFTLVELSIVLVIIGLLIGGILVGQSLIHSSKINRVVKDLSQYDIALAAFRDKYKQLPGDSNKVFPAGDNDGLINLSEAPNVWAALSVGAGLKSKKGGFYQSSSSYLSKETAPVFDLSIPDSESYYTPSDPNTTCLALVSLDLDSAVQTPPNFIYFDWSWGHPTYAGCAPTSVIAMDALAIDKKIDDAIPGTGNMRALGKYLYPCTDQSTEYSLTSDGNYDAENGVGCNIQIKSGAFVGYK